GLAIHGCEAPTSEAPEPQRQVDGDDVPSGWRAPAGACALDPAEPSRLVLTTTDFATGAITVVDLDDGSVEADVAVGSTDAVPFEGPGTVVVVHRHQLDRIDVLDADTWALRGQHAVPSTEGSANPHAVAFDERGRAWVTTFGDPWLRALDLGRAAGAAELARVDLSVVADDDG